MYQGDSSRWHKINQDFILSVGSLQSVKFHDQFVFRNIPFGCCMFLWSRIHSETCEEGEQT